MPLRMAACGAAFLFGLENNTMMDSMRRSYRFLLLVALWLVLLGVACAMEESPDLVLRGRLSGNDHQTYRELPFDVPVGVNRITVQFDYTGRDEHATVDLGLLGPGGFKGQEGFRGWSGGSKHLFTLGATDATASFLPGPIQAGRWILLLGIPNLRQATHAEYTAKIWFGHPGDPAWQPAVMNPPLRQEAGWYRGDLHMHGAHSDGSCTTQSGRQRAPCPLYFTVEEAARRGLDFIALSDHNTVSQANDIRELQPYFDRLLLIPAREVTTFQGHANLFGTTESIDFRVGSKQVPDWNALLRQIDSLHGVLSINHPIRPNDETCMGCGWTPRQPVDMQRVQAIEAVNGMDAMLPNSGIPFWQHWLDLGYRLTAIGGSDNHEAKRAFGLPGMSTIGTPTTVVHADALSMQAILAGIRAGHVFVDVQGSRDRMLDLTARVDSASAEMGDALGAPKGRTVRFSVSVKAPAGSRVETLVDGKALAQVDANVVNEATQHIGFEWLSDGQRHWVRSNVRDANGQLLLIGNPIYLNYL
jgi:hypothetical protein